MLFNINVKNVNLFGQIKIILYFCDVKLYIYNTKNLPQLSDRFLLYPFYVYVTDS